MLEHWLHPLSKNMLSRIAQLPAYSLAQQLQLHTASDGMPSIPRRSLAIIGWDENADDIRRQLYPLAWRFGALNCTDLGNLKRQGSDFGTALVRELIESGVIPIVIGGPDVSPIPQFIAHKDIRKYTNITIIDEKISYNVTAQSPSFINTLIQSYGDSVFHLEFLAYQSHFCDPQLGQWLESSKYGGLRLGQLRSNIEEAEPAIRDADMLVFYLDALKWSECPGVNAQSPNGLSAEEACQLSLYAGMSDKLGSFTVVGYQPSLDVSQQSAQVVAQMVWYFIEGYYHRKGDFPISSSGMKEYVVDYKHLNYQLTFWKSSKSGRWWMQIPLRAEKGLNRHRLIPCSYKDYQLAAAGELPNRLLRALERLG